MIRNLRVAHEKCREKNNDVSLALMSYVASKNTTISISSALVFFTLRIMLLSYCEFWIYSMGVNTNVTIINVQLFRFVFTFNQ